VDVSFSFSVLTMLSEWLKLIVITATSIQVPGMKYLLNQVFGYSPMPRGPLLPLSEAKGASMMQDPAVVEILEFEKKLAGQ
jgi:hypothetical protein